MAKQLATLGAASLGLAALGGVSADLPIHCIRPQVTGDWVFFLGKPSEKRTTCGHRTPDIDSAQPEITGESY